MGVNHDDRDRQGMQGSNFKARDIANQTQAATNTQ